VMLGFKNLFRNPAITIFSKSKLLCPTVTPLSFALNLHKPFLPFQLQHVPSYAFRSSRPQEKMIPGSIPTFKTYDLSQSMMQGLSNMEIYTPTPIQDLVIKEWFKSKRNIAFAAQTGTGKTLAYAIPLIESLKREEEKAKTILTVPRRPRAVIFVPNKELVMQTQEVIKKICHSVKLKTVGICGRDSFHGEVELLDDGIDILITTLDRFEKHHNKHNVHLSQATHLIFDEMDTFLDASYEEQINKYVDIGIKLPTKPRMVFLSSTFTEKMKKLFVSNFGSGKDTFALLIDKNTHYNLSNLQHDFLHIAKLDKQQPLLGLLSQYKKYIEKTEGGTIIFCNSIPSCQSLEYFLRDNGYDSVMLHGDVPKKLRIQNFERFKRREINLLLSTDLGSRGLDFPWVNHIINFDFPKTASDYLHRAGRAGRAGRKGYVSSLYHNKDFKLIQELQDSNNEGRPLNIKGSAYETFQKKEEKKQPPRQDDGLARIAKSPELQKLVPADYIQFRKQWDDSQVAKQEHQGRVRGFKPGKDIDKGRLRELKKKIKMPKNERNEQRKFIKSIQNRIKGLTRKIRTRGQENGAAGKSPSKARGRGRSNNFNKDK